MKTITPTIAQLRMLASIQNHRWLMFEPAVPDFALAALDVPEKATEGLNIATEDFFQLRPEATLDSDGIATVHIHGALMDSCPPVYEKLGLVTCYSTIMGEIQSALDAGARGVMLATDSPGGTVSGNREAAEFIAELPVPVVAHASGMACSAAYKLIAGSDEILATPSATVGNIGTILSWADCSEFWRQNGIEFKAITSEGADLKSTFHTEPNAAQLAFLKSEIDEMGKHFRDHVAAHREDIDPEVWRAGWYHGETAGRLGLIDGIGSQADARTYLLSLIDTA